MRACSAPMNVDVVVTEFLLLRCAGINELGEEGEVEVRFFDNPDCQEAFRNYFCWLNFPRCDDEDESLILCRSTCENLMEACEVRRGRAA